MCILNGWDWDCLHNLGTVIDLLMELLELGGDILLVVGLRGDPGHILIGDLLLDDVLEPRERVVIGELLVQVVQVEDVVPQHVVLVDVVLLQLDRAFLECLAGLSADEAQSFLVVLYGFPVVPQARERVDHDTRDNVAEDQIHKDRVHQVEHKPRPIELVHIITDFLADVEGHYAAHDRLAVLLRDVLRVYRGQVGAEPEH